VNVKKYKRKKSTRVGRYLMKKKSLRKRKDRRRLREIRGSLILKSRRLSPS
jgi:hypothetical protein